MKITSLPHHLKVYVPDNLNKNMSVARALEALIHAAGGVTETRSTGGWFNPDNMLSTCCGAPEDDLLQGFCGQCRDGCGWEPGYVAESVTVYEFYSTTALHPADLVKVMLAAEQEAVMVIRNEGVWERVSTAVIYEKETT